MLLAILAALLVIPQPDLGTGMVYVAVGFSILFFAGTSFKQITALVAIFVASIAIVLAGAPAVGVHVLKPYQVQRLTAFLHPSGAAKSTPGVPDPCYQLQQAEIAIGSGQKTGRGNNATQTKLNFLPANDTDFVFAAVGETYGFVGAAVVLSLYALLIWRALRILTMSQEPVRDADRGGHPGDAHVPDLRERGYDHWDHAHHRRPSAAPQLRRLLGHRDLHRHRAPTIHLRPGPNGGQREARAH